MRFLSEIIVGPYAGIIVLAAGILITLFAGFSRSRKINIFITAVNAFAYAASIYMYIRNFMISGAGSSLFIDNGMSGVILSVIILFCGLNLIFLISPKRLSDKSFVRIVILLSFSLISVLFLIMSDNIVFFMVSFIITVLSIFNLLASVGGEDIPVKEYVGRFGMRAAVPAVLILFGFSTLVGMNGIGSLSSYINMENTSDPLFMISTVVFAGAIYLYFFLYPFQGIYLRLARRVDASSASTLWFLYVPAGMVLLIKFDLIFSNYYGKENIYGFVILAVFAFTNLIGAGLGSIRAFSVKRILSMFMIFQLGTILLVKAAGFTNQGSSYEAGIYDLAVLVIILVTFLPLSVLVIMIEKGRGEDNLEGLQGLIKTQPYPAICLIILFIWGLAADVYIFFLKGPIKGLGLTGQGAEAAILSIGYIAALILLIANIVRIIIVFFRKSPETGKQETLPIPRVFYVYLSFFVVLAVVSIVLIAIGKAGIGQDNINIWGSIFYIFGSGN